MIAIVDYGMGNVASIANMLRKVGASATLTRDPDVLAHADKLILPGVGAFDTAMQHIDALGLRAVLDRKALQDRVPILGVCLGMQILTQSSEEGVLPGLGWLPAQTRRFRPDQMPEPLRVPHMGWNQVRLARQSPLFVGAQDPLRFYFVHSYHVVCEDETDVLTRTLYGYEFASGVQRGNIMGVQFHPEKSHRFGLALYANFARL